MKVRIIRKYGELIHSFNVDGPFDESKKLIPELGDHVTVDEQGYIVVDRNFDIKKDVVTIQCWQPVAGEPEDF